MASKIVLATFVYSDGHRESRIFQTMDKAEWAAHMEGDHLISWSTQEIDA